MRIVVAGGTGFLGRHIARALLDAGHDVAVLGRNPAKVPRIPLLQGAGAVRGDVTSSPSLSGRLDGADAVVMAAQFPNHPVEVERRGLTYDAYDHRGTRNLLAEARRAGVERFFYVSGAGADPASDKTWYRAKGKAEEAVRAGGLEHVILRPSWAYGPEDRALNRFVQMARLTPFVVVPGTRPQRIQPVFVDDIAAAARRAFEVPEAWGSTFEIGCLQVLTMRDVVDTMLRVMGKRRIVVHLPAVLLKAATAPLTILPKPPMSPAGIEFATQDGLVDPRPLIDTLGVEPRSLEEGLETYLAPRPLA